MKRSDGRRTAAGIIATLLMNGLLPYVLYKIAIAYTEPVPALIIATTAPLAENIIHIARRRSIDAFGLLMLSVFALSITLAALGGDEKLVLARESFVTAAVGLGFLASLGLKRPFMYHLACRFTAGPGPEARETFAGRWKYPYFRRVLRILSLGWGLALLAEAAVRIVLIYKLPVERFLAVNPFVFYACIGLLALWTIGYRKTSARKLADIMKAS